MDQASFLRELMNKKQKGKMSPFAILTTSDYPYPSSSILPFVEWFSKKTQRTSLICGLGRQNEFEKCVKENTSIEDKIEKSSQKTSYVSGNLDFISDIRKDPILAERFVGAVKTLELSSDTMFYYAGKGLETTAINLTMLTNKVLVFMKPTTKSLMELTNYIKIFSKTKVNTELGIIFDMEDEEEFRERSNKIQELYWKQFKYYIEPIGYFDSKRIPLDEEPYFEKFNFDYMLKKTETKMFSETIENMFL